MKNKPLLVIVLFCAFNLRAQNITVKEISKIEIFAIKLNSKGNTYSESEKDIKEMADTKKVFHKTISSKRKISNIFSHSERLIPCENFKGLIYPKIIMDIYFLDGHKEKLIVSSLQNISINKKVFKQNPDFFKEIKKLLPLKLKRGSKAIEPIESFCH